MGRFAYYAFAVVAGIICCAIFVYSGASTFGLLIALFDHKGFEELLTPLSPSWGWRAYLVLLLTQSAQMSKHLNLGMSAVFAAHVVLWGGFVLYVVVVNKILNQIERYQYA